MSSTFSQHEPTTKKTKSSTPKTKEKRTKKKVELLDFMQVVFFDTQGVLYLLETNENKELFIVDLDQNILPWDQLPIIYRVGIRNRAYINAEYHYYPFSLSSQEEFIAVMDKVASRSHVAKQMKESYWKFINFFTFVNEITEQAFYSDWGFYLHQTEVSCLHYNNRKKMTSRIIEEEATSWVEIRNMKTNELVHQIPFLATLNVYFDQLLMECMQGYLYYSQEDYTHAVKEIALRCVKESDKKSDMLYQHRCPKRL